MKKSGVYSIVNIVNGKRYVGSSCNIRKRWGAHVLALNTCNHENKHLQASWVKHSVAAFTFIIEEECCTEALLSLEDVYMNTYKSMNQKFGYNIRPAERPTHSVASKLKIGLANTGRKKTEETLSKMSKAASGKKKSDATKAKISAALKGRITGDETKLKLSVAAAGRTHNAATKAKISLAGLGRKQATSTIEKRALALKGHVCSDATKLKISTALTGLKRSDETKRRLSLVRTGQVVSLATREKIAASHRLNKIKRDMLSS